MHSLAVVFVGLKMHFSAKDHVRYSSKNVQQSVMHVSVYAKSHFHVHEVKCHRNHVLASLIVIDVCAGHFCTGGHNRKQRNLLHLQVTCRQTLRPSSHSFIHNYTRNIRQGSNSRHWLEERFPHVYIY